MSSCTSTTLLRPFTTLNKRLVHIFSNIWLFIWFFFVQVIFLAIIILTHNTHMLYSLRKYVEFRRKLTIWRQTLIRLYMKCQSLKIWTADSEVGFWIYESLIWVLCISTWVFDLSLSNSFSLNLDFFPQRLMRMWRVL